MTIKSIRTGWTGISMQAGNPAYGDFESIATATVTAGGGSTFIEFTSIPSTFQHLQIRAMARSILAGNADDYLRMTFNGNTSAVYDEHELNGDGASVTTGVFTNQNSQIIQRVTASNAASGIFGVFVLDILDYTNTNKNKVIRNLGGNDRNGAGRITLNSGSWRNTSAITSIKIEAGTGTGLAQYSHFALYGIR